MPTLPKVIILAAGQSKRMDPLPDKNFIEFCGKPLLMWQVEQLRDAGFRDICVIGGRHNLDELKELQACTRTPKNAQYSHQKAKSFFEVLEQKKLEDGMAGAVLTAEKWIGDDAFLVVSSNDIVESSIFELLKKAMKKAGAKMGGQKTCGFLLAKKVTSYFPGGYLKLAKNGAITGIVEKPGAGNEPSDLVNLVFHYHAEPKKLFSELKKTTTSRDDRYEVALNALIQEGLKGAGTGATYVALPYAGNWQAVKYPWHLLSVWQSLFATMTTGMKKPKISKKATIAKTAIIRGAVIIEDGVKVFDHAVIQGPAYIGKNCIIANNSLVRESHLGAGSVAGFGTEIARSFLSHNVWTHTNYIGDSVIGSNSSFGSGTVTGNLRLDEKNIPVVINGEKIDSGMNKLGAIVGENVRVGINTSIMPGVKIGNNCFVGGGISLAQDIPDSKFVYGKWELIIKDNSASVDPSAREKMMNKLKR